MDKSVNEKTIIETCKAVKVSVGFVKLFRNKDTLESIGSAIVFCLSGADAGIILKELNNKELNGKPLRIMLYDPSFKSSINPNASIVIYHLPPCFKQKNLYDKCSEFGSVKSCYIPQGDKGQQLGIGFVMFETESSKDIAIEKLHNTAIVEGSIPLKVYPYFSKTERVIHKYTKGGYNNLYVKGIPKDQFTEGDLTKLFCPHGELLSIVLNKDKANPKLNSGTAFVCFKKNEDAASAKAAVNGVVIDGCKLSVDRHYKKAELEALREAKKLKSKEDFHSFCEEKNLYVKPIPKSIGEKELKEEFSKFGTIIAIKVPPVEPKAKSMKRPRKVMRFGLICFNTKEEAKSAIQAMDGKVLWGRPIRVKYSQNKEERAREKEKLYASRFEMEQEALGTLPAPPYPFPLLTPPILPPTAISKSDLPTPPMPIPVPPPEPIVEVHKELEKPHHVDC